MNPSFFFPYTLYFGANTASASVPFGTALPQPANPGDAFVLMSGVGQSSPGLYVADATATWRFVMPFLIVCDSIINGYAWQIYVAQTAPITMESSYLVYRNGQLVPGNTINVDNAVYCVCVTGASSSGGASKLNIDKTNTLAIIGDEITAKYFSVSTSSGTTTTAYNASGFITWAQFCSNQRMQIVSSPAVANSTVVGTGATSLLGQIQTVILSGAANVFVLMGIHDLLNGVPVAQLKSAYLTAMKVAAAAGVRIFWSTLTPVSSPYVDASKGLSYQILNINRWIRQTVADEFPSQSVVLVDLYSVAAETSSSNSIDTISWATNFSSDGITPINIGAMAMGQYLGTLFTAAVSAPLSIASLDTDDIVNNPISRNVISNSLLDIFSVKTLTIANNTGCTAIPTGITFTGGTVSSNVATEGTGNATANISLNAGVLTVTITSGGAYSVAPTGATFTGGTWGGTPATVSGLSIQPYKWSLDQYMSSTMAARSDGFGNNVDLSIAYPAFNYTSRMAFTSILYNNIHNYIAPDDNFQVSCAMTVGGTTDANVAAAPMIEGFGTVNAISMACASAGTDMAMSNYNGGATLSGTWITPPWTSGTSISSTSVYINCVNNSADQAGTTGVCAVGRISGYIDPSYSIPIAAKANIKWNPGHYVICGPEFTYENFIAQDDFNTGSSRPVLGGEVIQTTAAWRGAEVEFLWSDLEPSEGVYNFANINDWLNGLSTFVNASGVPQPRHLIAYIFADTYVNPASYSIPSYILNNPIYGGIAGATAGQYGTYPHQSSITSFTITNGGSYSSTSGVTVSVTGGGIAGGTYTPVWTGSGPYTLSGITINSAPTSIISTPTVAINGGTFTTQAQATANWNATGHKLLYQNPNVQARFIALAQAIAAAYDSNPYFEGLRFDETAVGDTFSNYFPGQTTAYVEGHLNVCLTANAAFKQTVVIKGFNYVADNNTCRFVRAMVEAGCGIGNVDSVSTDPLLNAYLNGPYYQTEQIYKTIPIYFRVDGGNYMSNGSTPQPIATIWSLMQTMCATHASWYREFPTSNSVDYGSVTQYLNGIGNQAFWENSANYNNGLKSYKPLTVRR